MKIQATEIRKIIIKLLNDKNIVEPVGLGTNVYGVQYKNLKRILIDKGIFTEGAIIGTLNTLTSRSPSIRKVKTEKGTFFYDYKSYKGFDFITDNTDLLENDIKNIENKINELLIDVRNAIKDSKSRNFIEKNNSRIEMYYLSEVLKSLTRLRSIADSYENDKLINDEKKGSSYDRD